MQMKKIVKYKKASSLFELWRIEQLIELNTIPVKHIIFFISHRKPCQTGDLGHYYTYALIILMKFSISIEIYHSSFKV